MLITIGQNTEKQMKILGIENYPFSASMLKQNFRNLIQINHPDKKGGSKEKAQNIIDAYNNLKNLALNDITEKDKNNAETIIAEQERDIFAVLDTCPNCKGIGEIISDWIQNKCVNCYSVEQRLFFTNKNRSSILLFSFNRNWLSTSSCKDRKCPAKTSKKICPKCKGTGKIEIKPFNPVIRKGAVMI